MVGEVAEGEMIEMVRGAVGGMAGMVIGEIEVSLHARMLDC